MHVASLSKILTPESGYFENGRSALGPFSEMACLVANYYCAPYEVRIEVIVGGVAALET